MHHSAFSSEIRANLPPPPPAPHPLPYHHLPEIVHAIPRNNISDFLTKIAHGEKLDIQVRTQLKGNGLADPGCLSRIRFFSIPDP
jgi:hypothetical protein